MSDVVSLLNQYGIDYTLGTTNLKCKCLNPFHDDSNPSFSIRLSDGAFQCWSCKIKGYYPQLYRLVTGKYYQLNKNEYWQKPVMNNKIKKIELPEIKIFGTLKDPLKNSDIRNFLLHNGILSDNFIRQKGIKYSTYSEMIAKHLVDVKDIKYTKMSDRICTPIYKKSVLVNMEGRTYKDKKDLYEEEPKVLYVKGGTTDLLYDWENIDITSDVVVVEGLKDYWKVWNVYNNCVPIFGNNLKDYQVELLNTVTGNIIAFCDNDIGGLGTYDKNDNLVINGMMQNFDEKLDKEFKVCYNPIRGKDPNDTDFNKIKDLITSAKLYNEILVDNVLGSNKIQHWT